MSHVATCVDDHHHAPNAVHEPIAAELHSDVSVDASPSTPGRAGRFAGFVLLPEIRWSALSLGLFLIGLLARVSVGRSWVTDLALAGCYAAGGWEPGLAGVRALRERTLDVDLLMIVAAIVAAAIGQVIDGGLLIVIFATSAALEAVATARTRESVRSLLDLAPEQACRVRSDGSEEIVATDALAVGDTVIVRPGERIGADGRVIGGSSEVDQASVTGEAMPVARTTGDEVFAGTVNGTGLLKVRVERAAADSVVARIVALVEEASATKATMQLFIEKIEQRYSIGMVTATIVLFAVPLAFGSALTSSLLRAMTFMIVASPCAVVLATMPPLLSAIASAGRHGVLVKSTVVMERFRATGLVAFDKTGTLTQGTPAVTDVWGVDASRWPPDRLLALAAAAEQGSEHPLGTAIVTAATSRSLRLEPASDFTAMPGQGVTATVAGRRVFVGRPASAGASSSAQAEMIERIQGAGRTAVVVTVDGIEAGLLSVSDQLRPDGPAAISALKDITGRPPIMLTGDNRGAAEHVASQVGIFEVHADLLPEGKVNAIRTLEDDGTRITLVGDGVNDAPALTAAHLGVAMGKHGSDLALETADAIIVRDELNTLPAVVNLSRRAKRIITQNLTFAGLVILGLVAIDLTGHLPLPLGVAGHEGSTVIVGLNGLRLLTQRTWDSCDSGSA